MTIGCLVVILAALMNASFAIPMRRMPAWAWENIWLIWSILALVILPWIAAFVTIPGLMHGYAGINATVIARVVFFGVLWGVAQVLFGLSVAKIGMALTFSIVLGLSAVTGTVIPFLVLHHDMLRTRIGAFVLASVVLIALGMALFARAGSMREREASHAMAKESSTPFRRGLALAVISGFCASFMGVGLSFADPLLQMATDHGSLPYWQTYAVWPLLLLGGALPNLAYCVFLLRKNKTWASFAKGSGVSSLLLCFTMAALWFGSSLLFGVATFHLGSLGPVLGWPMFMAMIVISASIFGWIAGEWKTASSRPLRTQFAGITVLTLAIILLSRVRV
jgi:L-rhamnose-H+ transport protein